MKEYRRIRFMIVLGIMVLTCCVGAAMAAEFTQKELAYMPASTQVELFKQIVAPSFETETVMQFAYAYSQGAPKFFIGNLFPTYEEVD